MKKGEVLCNRFRYAGYEPPEVESSSSISKNSDDEEVGSSASDEESEAQSRHTRRLYAMEELELVLPIRRGISKTASRSRSPAQQMGPRHPGDRQTREHARSETQEAARIQSCRGQWTVLASQGQCHGRDFKETSRIEQEHVSPGRRYDSFGKLQLQSLALAVVLTHSASYGYSTASEDSSFRNFTHSPPPAIHLPPLNPRSQGSHEHYGSDSEADLLQQATPIESNVLKTGLEEQT